MTTVRRFPRCKVGQAILRRPHAPQPPVTDEEFLAAAEAEMRKEAACQGRGGRWAVLLELCLSPVKPPAPERP